MTIKAYGNNVVITSVRYMEQTTDFGIIIPTDARKNGRFVTGMIESIGPKANKELSVGQRVLFYPKLYDPISRTDDYQSEVFVIPSKDVIAIIDGDVDIAIDART